MNRRPTDEKLGDMLKTPHFGNSSSLPAADPIAPTPMVLTLQQVKPYDRNPRRERNPLYDEIKESIRAQHGLNNPLTVTRRPGEELYMVESGGNTRLQILNELLNETGEDVFNQLHVLYRPWQSETHVLTAHLIENEKRGDMLFIDKALAVRELKLLFESETEQSLSLRQLTQRLKEVGLSVDSSVISRMDYSLDVLLSAIPEALRAGLGKPQIERIRKLEKAFQQYWTELAKQDAELFSEIFNDCLTENNRPEWDANALRDTLEERLVEFLQVPIRSLRLDIDALLHGRALEAEPLGGITAPSIPIAPTTIGTNVEPPEEGSTHDTPLSHSTRPNPTLEHSASETQESEQAGSYSYSDDEEEITLEHSSIAVLRQKTYESAYQLATQYQLDEYVHLSSDWGLGFLIDLPNQPLVSEKHQDLDAKQRWELMLRQWVWWMLYICSEETARPERITNIPESLVIRRLCLEGNQKELMRLLGQPAWLSLAAQLLADPLFPDRDYCTLMALIHDCRTLRQTIDGDDDPLWLERNNYAAS